MSERIVFVAALEILGFFGDLNAFFRKIRENGGRGFRMIGAFTWGPGEKWDHCQPQCATYWRTLETIFSKAHQEKMDIFYDFEDQCSIKDKKKLRRHWLSKVTGGFFGRVADDRRMGYIERVFTLASKYSIQLYPAVMNEFPCDGNRAWYEKYFNFIWKRINRQILFPSIVHQSAMIPGDFWRMGICDWMCDLGGLYSRHGKIFAEKVLFRDRRRDYAIGPARLIISNDGGKGGTGGAGFYGNRGMGVKEAPAFAKVILDKGYRGVEVMPREIRQHTNGCKVDLFDPRPLRIVSTIVGTLPEPLAPIPPIPPPTPIIVAPPERNRLQEVLYWLFGLNSFFAKVVRSLAKIKF